MMGMKKRIGKRGGGGVMKKRMKRGGDVKKKKKGLKKVDAKKNPGLAKLPKKVRGMIDMNGRIDVNKNLSEKQKAETIAHERLHLQQMRDGVLKFDRNNYYYKPKVNGFTLIIPTKLVDTRRRDLPWEESVIQKIKKLKKNKK